MVARDVTAAILIIGDEILSGRTEDKNTGYIARWLNETGIGLMEARVVPDIEDEIVTAVNQLRGRYDYLFTTGGIGPTHDDITADAIARAFDVPIGKDPDAYVRLLDYYGVENFTEARQRMSRVPKGGELIDNPVSIAPGFKIENVFVLAGVPKVMQAMLESLRPHLKGGRQVISKTLTVHAPESAIAGALADIQDAHPEVSIGSYPFYAEGKGSAQIVVRAIDATLIDAAMADVAAFCRRENWDHTHS